MEGLSLVYSHLDQVEYTYLCLYLATESKFFKQATQKNSPRGGGGEWVLKLDSYSMYSFYPRDCTIEFLGSALEYGELIDT